jgi:XTP/dITP diphosphohydrolase
VPDQQRTARFRCVIALSSPDGEVEWVEGKIEGRIATEARGSNGFGYDPIFFVPEYGKTFAELDSATKNKISHRGCALEEARRLIARHLK